MKKRSKRYKNIKKAEVKDKKLNANNIIDLVKKNSTSKFDESVDVSLKINLKQSKGGDFSLRTVVKLPNGSGKKEKIAVLCEQDKISEAKKSGAEIFGAEDLIEKIAAKKRGSVLLPLLNAYNADQYIIYGLRTVSNVFIGRLALKTMA